MRPALSLLAMTLAAGPAIWVDPASQLMWTATDNRASVSALQAARYCEALHTAGFADWRLPTIDELQFIYQPHGHASAAFHVRGPLELSGWQWSATPGLQTGETWAFDFGDGGRASVANGDSGMNRALCVRAAH